VNAKDLMAAGRLSEARAQLTAEVKAAPTDAGKRTLLFQVLAFLGEWEKAEKHLDLIGTLSPSSSIGVQAYRDAISAEKERRDVVDRKKVPNFLTDAPSYLDTYFAAWDALASGKTGRATKLYKEVDQRRPPTSGSVKGKSFIGFVDIDTFLSCFLEAIVLDRYVWVPFESLRELVVGPPKTFLDLLWAPAALVTWEGMNVACYLPVCYPGSVTAEDERAKLGRMTDWLSLGGPFCRGVGQHVFTAGREDIPLLEMGEVTFTRSAGKEQK